MTAEYTQSMAIVIDMDALVAATRESGDGKLNLANLLAHFRLERGARRSIHRIHVVVGAERLSPALRDELLKMRIDIHYANNGRPECLLFHHAHQAAELYDVIALLISDAGYLPLLRHVKGMGCRVELHALPTSDPVLFPAADELIGLLPPIQKGPSEKRATPQHSMSLAA